MITSRLVYVCEHKAWPYLLLAAAILLAYCNIYHNAFLFDDDLLIKLNHFLRDWDPTMLKSSTTDGARIAGGFYRPVQIFLYFIIFQINGLDPFYFHVLNLTVHIGNACLGYALGRKFGFNPVATFLAMLVWALHPLHVEAVTYMSGSADPLFVFFCLLSLVLIAPEFKLTHIIAITPLFALAVLSKETAVVLPALIVVCLYLTSPDRLKPMTYVRTLPLWIIAFAYLAWRTTAPGFDGPQTYQKLFQLHDFDNLRLYSEHPSWRIDTFLASMPAYLKLLVWPVGLRLERSFTIFDNLFDGQVMLGFLMVGGALAQIIWGRGKYGLALSWGFLWFGAAHFPNAGLFVPMNSLFLEHWMYLPTIGLFLGIAQTIAIGLQKPNAQKYQMAAACAGLALAGAAAARTNDQNAVWHDPITFYTHIFKYGDESARAHNNLALAYVDRHDLPHAFEEFNKAIATTDTYAETQYNYALAILNQPDQKAHVDEAIKHLNHSLEIDPKFYRSYDALAKIYAFQGDTEKAAYNRQMADKMMAATGHSN